MAPFIAIVLSIGMSIGILALFGIAAIAWGVDSRPSVGDDHAR